MKGKILHGLCLSPDSRSQAGINKTGAPSGSIRSRKGPTLLILEPQRTLSVVQTGLRDLEPRFCNWGAAAVFLPRLRALQTTGSCVHCEGALRSCLLRVWTPGERLPANNKDLSYFPDGSGQVSIRITAQRKILKVIKLGVQGFCFFQSFLLFLPWEPSKSTSP